MGVGLDISPAIPMGLFASLITRNKGSGHSNSALSLDLENEMEKYRGD